MGLKEQAQGSLAAGCAAAMPTEHLAGWCDDATGRMGREGRNGSMSIVQDLLIRTEQKKMFPPPHNKSSIYQAAIPACAYTCVALCAMRYLPRLQLLLHPLTHAFIHGPPAPVRLRTKI